MSLKALGWSADAMRLVVLWDNRRKIHHAILEITLGGRSLLLGQTRAVPFRWSDAPEFHPIFALSEHDYWIMDAHYRPRYDARYKDSDKSDLSPIGP